MKYSWSHPETPAYYERFCRRHPRYGTANAALVRNAALEPDHHILDAGAGTGRTAEAALPSLGARGRILCFEPSPAMRAAGRARIRDPRIRWVTTWPSPPRTFHRVLIGAAIWQMTPLQDTFLLAAELIQDGGALCFNIPSLYLGVPDQPGGGSDPLLLHLPHQAARGESAAALPCEPLPGPRKIEAALRAAGFRPERWSFRLRLTQSAYRDWLKIPVTTNYLLAGLNPRQRARRLDEAFRQSDPTSWRWEHWTGWTAWK
jgi:hypothetical protein